MDAVFDTPDNETSRLKTNSEGLCSMGKDVVLFPTKTKTDRNT
jgi:hypothetical protein